MALPRAPRTTASSEVRELPPPKKEGTKTGVWHQQRGCTSILNVVLLPFDTHARAVSLEVGTLLSSSWSSRELKSARKSLS